MRFPLFAILACSILFCGCSDPTADLTGKVLYQDQPLTQGNVKIFDGNGLVHSCKITPEGTYAFKGIGVGEIKFLVSSVRDKERIARLTRIAGRGTKGAVTQQPVVGASTREEPAEQSYSRIPAKYMSVADTDLSTQVEKGANSFDLVLVDDAE